MSASTRLTIAIAFVSFAPFYAAVLVGGRLTIKGADGNESFADNFKAAPAIGLSLTHRF